MQTLHIIEKYTLFLVEKILNRQFSTEPVLLKNLSLKNFKPAKHP